MMPGYIPPPSRWGRNGDYASNPFRGCIGLCVAIAFSAVIIFVLIVLLHHVYH
jgi:hypothetical protein